MRGANAAEEEREDGDATIKLRWCGPEHLKVAMDDGGCCCSPHEIKPNCALARSPVLSGTHLCACFLYYTLKQ